MRSPAKSQARDPITHSLSPPREPAIKLKQKGRPTGSINKRCVHDNSTRRDPSQFEIMERDSQREAVQNAKALNTEKEVEKQARKEARKQAKKKEETTRQKAETAAEKLAEREADAAKKKAERDRQKDREKARQEFNARRIAKATATAKVSPLHDPVPKTRKRRRALSEDPDEYIPELHHPPSNQSPPSNHPPNKPPPQKPVPHQRRRIPITQGLDNYQPELEEGWKEWNAREDEKDQAELRQMAERELEKILEGDSAREKAVEKPEEAARKRKVEEEKPARSRKQREEGSNTSDCCTGILLVTVIFHGNIT